MASLDTSSSTSPCAAPGVPPAAQHPKTSSGVQLWGHDLCIWAGWQAAVGNSAGEELNSVLQLPFPIPILVGCVRRVGRHKRTAPA